MQQCNFFLSEKEPEERRRILEFLIELMTTTRSKEIQARVGMLYEQMLSGERDFYEGLRKRGLLDANGDLKPELEAEFVREMFARQEGQFRLANEAAGKLVESYRAEMEREGREKVLEKVRGDMEALGQRVNVGGYTGVDNEAGTDAIDRAVRSAGRQQAEAIAEEVFSQLEVITNQSRRERSYDMEIYRRNVLGGAYQAAYEQFVSNPTEGTFETFAQTVQAGRKKAGLREVEGFERYRTFVDEKEVEKLKGRLENLTEFDRSSREALQEAQRQLEQARRGNFGAEQERALREAMGRYRAGSVFEGLKVKETADPGFRERTRETRRAGRASGL